jgi:hypothetical protein
MQNGRFSNLAGFAALVLAASNQPMAAWADEDTRWLTPTMIQRPGTYVRSGA